MLTSAAANAARARPCIVPVVETRIIPAGGWLSAWSERSVLSIASSGSVLSVGSVGSVLSVGSVGSAVSVFSIGSFLSTGSVLSFRSRWSLMSAESRAATLGRRSRGPATIAGGPPAIVLAVAAVAVAGWWLESWQWPVAQGTSGRSRSS